MAKRSLNQATVAKKLGISTSYLSLISNGKRNPNLRLSTKLANILDVELLDLFPQNNAENEEFLDVIVACSHPAAEYNILVQALNVKGYRCQLVQGEFDLGYMTSVYRPKMLVLGPDMVGNFLINLRQRLAMEPLTSHIRVMPLITATGDLATRRKKQIDKIGLEPCEWDAQNPTNVVESITLILS